MIRVQGLGKEFRDYRRGRIPAIVDVSFECHPGQVYGLLGPNGAGKTTTLRILSTMLRPTAGSAHVAQFDVSRQSEQVRRRIGYLSTTTALYDRMTGSEVVEFFGRLSQCTPRELSSRIEELFDWLDLGRSRDVPVAKLSTGMRQKVAIARALVHDPPVLIFDEPTSGLDVLVARNLIERIAQLRNQGKTILFSTHAMHEAHALCDQMAILYRGRILAEGAPSALLERHGQSDLEALFFALIHEAEEGRIASS